MPFLSIIIPTIGRDHLYKTLVGTREQMEPTDELIVIGDGPCLRAAEIFGQVFDQFKSELPHLHYLEFGPTRDAGHSQRNFAQTVATGVRLVAMDDDDLFADGALATIREVAAAYPESPMIFRMQYHAGGKVLWDSPHLGEGNVGTPMFVPLNRPDRLGTWTSRYGGDFDFISATCALQGDPIFREEIIALIGVGK